jgi:mRNA interferase MazF
MSHLNYRQSSMRGIEPAQTRWTLWSDWREKRRRMKRGEVWRVRIPYAPGHAQSGERPAIIVQDDPLIASLPTVLIVPFTSTAGAARFDATLMVQPDSQNGLSTPSVALVFQMRALDKRDLVHRLGVLDSQTLDHVFRLLDQLTGR